MDDYTARKAFYVCRVSCPDVFSFSSTLNVMRSIYGSDVIIEFLCV